MLLFDIWTQLTNNQSIWNLLIKTSDCVNIVDAIKNKKTVVASLTNQADVEKNVFLTSILLNLTVKAYETIQQNDNKMESSTIYLDSIDGVADESLLQKIFSGTINAAANKNNRIALVAHIKSLDRMLASVRNHLSNRTAILCAFQTNRNAAAIVAQHITPVENIYTGSSERNYQILKKNMDMLINLQPQEYILHIREATVVCFC